MDGWNTILLQGGEQLRVRPRQRLAQLFADQVDAAAGTLAPRAAIEARMHDVGNAEPAPLRDAIPQIAHQCGRHANRYEMKCLLLAHV